MNMEKRAEYQGTEMADLMWNLAEHDQYDLEGEKVIWGNVLWEDCLEFADMLYKAGYRRVAEPETNNIIKGEVVQ